MTAQTAFALPGPRCQFVPRCLRSYAVFRLPIHHKSKAPVPLAFNLPMERVFFSFEFQVPASRNPLEIVCYRFSDSPVLLHGNEWDLPDYWTVLFVRAPVEHPAGGVPASPCHGGIDTSAFRSYDTLGIRNKRSFSRLHFRGSHARATTHQPDSYLPACKSRYRPAGLSFSRMGFAPIERFTDFL